MQRNHGGRGRGGGGGVRGVGRGRGGLGAGLLGQAPMPAPTMDNMSTGMKRLLGGGGGGGLLGNAPGDVRGRIVPQKQPQRGLLEHAQYHDEQDQWYPQDDVGYQEHQGLEVLDDRGYGRGEQAWQESGEYVSQDYHDEYATQGDNYEVPHRIPEVQHRLPEVKHRLPEVQHRNQHAGIDMDYRHDDRQIGRGQVVDSGRGLFEQGRHLQGQQRREGLLEEPRGLLDKPDIRRGLLDEPRRLLEHVETRGSVGLLNEAQGRFDMPDRRREFIDDMGHGGGGMMNMNVRRGDGLLDPPDPLLWQQQQAARDVWPDRGNRQQDLLEKADLQIRLLQEEKMKEEATRMIRMEEERQKQRNMMRNQRGRGKDGLLGSGPGRGGIPSIFDLFEGPRKLLGKRPGSDSGRGRNDNKRHRQSDNRSQQDRNHGRRDRDSRSSRDRSGPRKSRFDAPKDSNAPTHSRNSPADSKKSKAKFVADKYQKDEKKSDGVKETAKGDKSAVAKETSVAKEKTAVKDTEPEAMETEKYDPAEPTEDAEMKNASNKGKTDESDSKTEDGQKKTGEADTEGNKKKEISLTVTVNKKGRSVNDADKKPEEQPKKEKKYKCNVCNVECFDEESFFRHMNGVKHVKKMGIVMSVAPQTLALTMSRKQAEEHLRKIEAGRKAQGLGKASQSGKALETLCKTCNAKFTGAYKEHKESAEHKEREARRMAGCKLCNVTSFNNFADYAKHLQSTWHKKNKQKNKDYDSDGDDMDVLVTLDTVGFEDDSGGAADRDGDVGMSPETPTTGAPMSTSTPKPSTTVDKDMKIEYITPVKPDDQTGGAMETEVPDKYDPCIAVGQRYVVSVTGFFCKLCHKFYNNETSAKIAHCQSETHFEKYKKAITARLAEMKKAEITASADEADPDNTSRTRRKVSTTDDNDDSQSAASPSKSTQNGGVAADQTAGNDDNEAEDTQYKTANESDSSALENAGNDTKMEEDDDNTALATEAEEEEEEGKAEELETSVTLTVTKPTSTPKARRGGSSPRVPRARRGRK